MSSKPNINAELDLLQHQSYSYFLHEANSANGLIIDKTSDNLPASIACTGMALAAYPVAVERGFMSRNAALERTLNTLRFFWNSPHGPELDATGYRGFYYHFLDLYTGRRAWDCELSTIDTVFLLAGALTAGIYFSKKTMQEQEIRTLANNLYLRADWQWAQNNGPLVTHGWKPECGFLNYRWEGYDEAILLYILGLGSPTHPLPDSCFSAWTSTYHWISSYGYEYLYAGPLFTHQLSHLWVDFRGIQDEFMRSRGIDYFENSRRAAYVQQQYAIDNPHKFAGYSQNCWGITACDGPGPDTITIDGINRKFFNYLGRGVPYGPDDGTLAPWVVVSSLPFAPEIALPVIDYYINHVKLSESNSYGFNSTFNPTSPINSLNNHDRVSP